ncbi:MAG TPA: hypothetical protein VFU43_26420 [Streptosporangiaceae bacterium]|nr:hypothetical protein [Streptosporangiaceae bacterium]
MRADAKAYVALYDSQAVRLHAYCWSLVGDQAAATVRDVFTAAAHPHAVDRDPRRRETALPGRLWLYRQARAECLRRGPITLLAGRDPLLRGAARLRADQREALVLAADLPPAGVARVLNVPPDRAIHLVTEARARLEQAVLKVLLADPATATHEDVIAAFERRALGALLARRAPAPPPGLRAAVIATMTRHQHTPLVVISPPAKAASQDGAAAKGRPAGRHARAAAPVIGAAAACAAAVIGVIAAGATLNFNASPAGGDGQGALAPSTAEHSQPGQQAAPGSGETPIEEVSPTNSAAPRPIDGSPGAVPSASSSTAADPATPEGAAAAGSPSEVPSTDPTTGAPTSPSSPSRPSDPGAPSDSAPPGPGSPSEDPSTEPPGGLLPGLPLIPEILGNAVSSVTGD